MNRKPLAFKPAYIAPMTAPPLASSAEQIKQHLRSEFTRVVCHAATIELQRLGELAASYDIDTAERGAWHLVALRIARDYVKNFRAITEPKAPKGRHRTVDRIRLVTDVTLRVAKSGVGVQKASEDLAESGKWEKLDSREIER